MPKKNGRPRKNPDEKRQQRSVYLSSETLQALQEINPNVSLAIQQLYRERMDSEAAARGHRAAVSPARSWHPGHLRPHGADPGQTDPSGSVQAIASAGRA